ncbi:phage portal protein, partial [Sharpea azabuensis]|uniref:phage portal protein n=1 Tax=Sharpea azabuensis TaxID=322505 RepID=UPI002E7FF0E4
MNAYKESNEKSICDLVDEKLGFAFQKYNISSYKPTELSAVFDAIERISNGIANMPWIIGAFDGGKPDEALYLNHLFDKCIQTRFILIKSLIKDVLIFGNGYAYIVRDNNGIPVNIIYLPHGQCSVYMGLYESSGEILYQVNSPLIQGNVEPCDILHLMMDSEDGINGIPILSFANKAINLSKYTEKAAVDYYGNKLRMTGVLSTDAPKLSPKQRQEIREAYIKGIGEDGGIAVLEGGMKFNPISNNAKDSALIDARLYNVQETARFFSMSPAMLGDLSHSSYSTLEQSQLDFLINTLASYVTMLQEEANRKLVLPNDKAKYYIDVNEDAVIKTDKQSYASYLSTLVGCGIFTINEARYLLGFTPV